MAKFANINGQTDDQLVDQLGQLKREQFNLRFQAATNQLEKPARVREVRRTIAQIKTLQAQRTSAGRRSFRTRSNEAADQDQGRCPSGRHLAPGGLRHVRN